tara:strand:+ start:880 stop:1155 length:276 start_codon:yes stop_codon:yes gene_type:complete
MPESESSDWSTYQRLVLSELKRLDGSLTRMHDQTALAMKHERRNRQQVEMGILADLAQLRTDIQSLKIKAGVWGAVAGMIPVISVLLLKQL